MHHLKQTPFSNLFYTSTVMFLWNTAGILDVQADHSASSQQVGGLPRRGTLQDRGGGVIVWLFQPVFRVGVLKATMGIYTYIYIYNIYTYMKFSSYIYCEL